MKQFRFVAISFLLLSATGLFPLHTLHAESPGRPEIGAVKAIQLASESLASRGLDKQVYIESVILEKTAVFEKERYWEIRWSEPIQRAGSKQREVGAKVTMSGRLVLLLNE